MNKELWKYDGTPVYNMSLYVKREDFEALHEWVSDQFYNKYPETARRLLDQLDNFKEAMGWK